MLGNENRMPHLSLVAAMFIWGFNGWIVSHITILNSVEIVFSRTLLGSLALLSVVLYRRSFNMAALRAEAPLLLFCGACLGLHWVMLFSAFRHAGVSLATLIDYTGPMIVIALSPFLFKEKLSWNKLIAMASVFLGVVFITGGITIGAELGKGLFFAVLSALSYAALIILNKQLHQMKGLEAAMCELMVACAVLLAYLLFTSGLPSISPGKELIYILFLGVVNTGLAFYLYFSAIQALSAQSSSLLSYIEPVSAVLVSALLLGEKLLPLQILGAILIIGGAMLGELKLNLKSRK